MSFPLSTRPWAAALFVLALLLLFVLALLPAPDIVQLLSWQDKLEHAFAFAALATLGWLAWPAHRLRIAAGLLLSGALMEVAQGLLTVQRHGDALDWVADALGVSVLCLLRRKRGS